MWYLLYIERCITVVINTHRLLCTYLGPQANITAFRGSLIYGGEIKDTSELADSEHTVHPELMEY